MTSSTLKYGINYIKQFVLKTLGVRIIEKREKENLIIKGFMSKIAFPTGS